MTQPARRGSPPRGFPAPERPRARLRARLRSRVLVSAGLVRGRHLTSGPEITDHVRNVGAVWSDEPVVHDRNWMSSRGPQDLPAFDRTIVAHSAGAAGREAPSRNAGVLPFGRQRNPTRYRSVLSSAASPCVARAAANVWTTGRSCRAITADRSAPPARRASPGSRPRSSPPGGSRSDCAGCCPGSPWAP